MLLGLVDSCRSRPIWNCCSGEVKDITLELDLKYVTQELFPFKCRCSADSFPSSLKCYYSLTIAVTPYQMYAVVSNIDCRGLRLCWNVPHDPD